MDLAKSSTTSNSSGVASNLHILLLRPLYFTQRCQVPWYALRVDATTRPNAYRYERSLKCFSLSSLPITCSRIFDIWCTAHLLHVSNIRFKTDNQVLLTIIHAGRVLSLETPRPFSLTCPTYPHHIPSPYAMLIPLQFNTYHTADVVSPLIITISSSRSRSSFLITIIT